jgi:predicted TPR repeat methyltransferase
MTADLPRAPSADAVLKQALAQHQAGRLQQAEQLYRAILQAQPFHPEANHNLGVLARQAGQPAAGLPYLKTALAVNPGSGKYLMSYTETLRALGKIDEVAAAYRRALELKPDFAEAHNNLGNALQLLQQLDGAAASFRRALEIKPAYVDAHNNLGVVLQSLGQLDDAAACFRRALKINPDYAAAHCNLGVALQALGQLDDAVASFRRALEIIPGYAVAHYNLGVALQSLGQLDDAVASYRRALEISPDYAAAYGNLGELLRTQGKLDDALACFRQLVRLMPANSVAQHQIDALTGTTTERAPAQYVQNIFDAYADRFDAHLQQELKYEAPGQLAALVTQHLPPSAEKWNVLDLGCGTGLVGSAIAPFARQLVGVDLSAKMLEKTRARNLYQRLEHADLLTMMRGESAAGYDAIFAADVFPYMGKLEELSAEIKRLLCPGGVFAFTVEALAEPTGAETKPAAVQEYRLENTGRYTHSARYLNRLASANGFLPLEMLETRIRMQRDKPVDGYLVLWKSREPGN